MIRCIFADRSQDFPRRSLLPRLIIIYRSSHPSKIGIFCRGPSGPRASPSQPQKKVFSCRGPQAPGPPFPSYQKDLFCSRPRGHPLATLSKNGLFVEGDPSGPQAFPSHPSKIGIFVGGSRAPPLTFPKIGLLFVVGPASPGSPLSYSPRKRHFLVGSS